MFHSIFNKLKKKQSPKIHVFVRHCYISKISEHKKRIKGYSKEICHSNLLKTYEPSFVNITYIYDNFYGPLKDHFLNKEDPKKIIEIHEGNEAGSFLKTLEYIASLQIDKNDIIYLLEDDYLHRDGWPYVLLEAFNQLPADYVTLYDHFDKYFYEMYENLSSKIYCSSTCHWRTIPSTTNTYAMRFSTLLNHIQIHKEYSLNTQVSKDHDKFLKLNDMGSILLSPMPAWSTHTEEEFKSPCIDWEEIIMQNTLSKKNEEIL